MPGRERTAVVMATDASLVLTRRWDEAMGTSGGTRIFPDFGVSVSACHRLTPE